MLDVLVLSCVPSTSLGKKIIRDFCNGLVAEPESKSSSQGMVAIYNKTMPLQTYPPDDHRKEKDTDVRFFDFSAAVIDPVHDNINELIHLLPGLLDDPSIQIAQVLLIANLEDIYQPPIKNWLCPFFTQQEEQVSERVIKFADVINNCTENSRIRGCALLTTSTIAIDHTPKVVMDALRYNASHHGFTENHVHECYMLETRKNAIELLKSTWECDAYQNTINDGVYFK